MEGDEKVSKKLVEEGKKLTHPYKLHGVEKRARKRVVKKLGS